MDKGQDLYPCVGICMADADSGCCLGCGRPPLAAPDIVAEHGEPGARPPTTGNLADHTE